MNNLGSNDNIKLVKNLEKSMKLYDKERERLGFSKDNFYMYF